MHTCLLQVLMNAQPIPGSGPPIPPKAGRPVISPLLTYTFGIALSANLVLIGFLIVRLGHFENAQKRAEEADQELAKAHTQQALLQTEIEDLQKRKDLLAPAVADWEKRLQEKAAAEALLVSFEERQRQIEADIARATNRVAQLNAELTGLGTQRAALTTELQKLRSEFDSNTRSNIDVRATLKQAAEAERRQSEAQTALDSATTKMKQIEADISSAQTRIHQTQKDADDLRQTRESLTTEIASLRQQAEKLENEIAGAQPKVADLRARQVAAQQGEQKLVEIQTQQTAAETRANDAEHRYQKVTTDLTNLVARVDQARKEACYSGQLA